MSNSLSLVSIAALLLAWAASICAFFAIITQRARIARVTGLIDDAAKKAHAKHEGQVPLVGGIAWFAAGCVFLGSYAIMSGFAGSFALMASAYPNLAVYLVFVGLFLALGLVDDIRGLSPRVRLVFSIAFAGLLVLMSGSAFLLHGVTDLFLGITVPLGKFAILVTIVAIIALVNALNMADGRDGIIAGITTIWCLALLSKSGDGHLSALLTACAINSIVLGWYNLKRQLFFGDAGTYAIAAAFGAATIFWHSHAAASAQLTALQVCSLFLIIVLDMIRLIVVRLRAGQSPMAADHNHLHHRLDDQFGWPAGLVIYLALVGIPITIAFQSFPSAGTLGTAFGIALYGGIIRMTNRRVGQDRTGGVKDVPKTSGGAAFDPEAP